jgi:DNA-binding MarR family transcriptional regulator
MTDQIDLDFTARARASDPGTSHAAARRIADRLSGLQARVLDALRECGTRGATTHELADMLRLDLVTVSPRLKPLELAGRVVRTTERREGRTVWRVA